jgi:hypothetical protein
MCSTAVLLVVAVGGAFLYLMFNTDRQPMASIGGCPSAAFPLRPSSSLNESAGLVSGGPPRTLGCWTTYSEEGSRDDVLRFYADPANTPGWTMETATFDSAFDTGSAQFVNNLNPKLQAWVDVSGKAGALFWRPGKARLDITICFCDPQIFVG